MIRKITEDEIRILFPTRPDDCNKGDFGYIALIGGSIEYSGAIRLAAMANTATCVNIIEAEFPCNKNIIIIKRTVTIIKVSIIAFGATCKKFKYFCAETYFTAFS